MVFSSLTFICVFLPLVFLAYYLMPRTWVKRRNFLLILASLFFYAFGEPVYVFVMLLSSTLTFIFGRSIGQARKSSQKRAKALLVFSIIVDLSFLGVFKYAGFLVSSLDAVSGLSLAIPAIALPIGISFYTFQSMSYNIDIYRGEVEACQNYLLVLLYISLFPQLTAGPIIKYHDIREQLQKRSSGIEDIARGMRRFCLGLAKKVLIANTMAVVADSIYGASLADVNILGAWLAALAYLMQIYFDFSGYSDMAIGLARMFGFSFKENFNYPYISTSIQEFWRRWHISLSSWFKEYLYIPLGGNRKGKLRAGLNKVVIFFTCGLWHGASWTFAIWGLFHGFFLLLESYLPIKRLPKFLGIIYSLLVVIIGFVLFRADSFGQGLYFIAQMFAGFHFEYASMSLALQQLTPLFIVAFLAAVVACTPIKLGLETRLAKSKVGLQRLAETASYVVAFGLLFVCLLGLSSGAYNPFIYFRF